MSNYITTTSDKSKKTALIVCALLGIFGGHQFYVGKIGPGLLYLYTDGLFCFGWIADLIKIATGGFRDNTGAPLRA